MATCYRCGILLIPKDQASTQEIKDGKFESEEHILPNFLGGHLTSWQLLCNHCNNILGWELDSELDRQLLLHELFEFKIDRHRQPGGYVPAYTTESGKKILVERGMKWKHFKPIIDISDKGEINKIVCQTLKEARTILTGLKRRYPNIDVEENLREFKHVEEYLGERIDFPNRTIGGPIVRRAIAKIALGYYLRGGGDVNLVRDLREYVITGKATGIHVDFYYCFSSIHDLAPDEVSHILFIRGDRKKGLLYCYIELFNTFNFIVLLSRDFEGPDFSSQYAYNVVGGNEIVGKKISVKLIGDIFDWLRYTRYRKKYDEEIQEYVTERIDRFWRLIENLTDPANEADSGRSDPLA